MMAYNKLTDIPYATTLHARQKLDLYLPQSSTKPIPLIVYIHGGAFKYGDKTTDRLPLRLVTQHSYALASLNYRLSGDAHFPAAVQDCKSAVRFLRANAAKYNLDPSLIVAMGESAGGHCASMLGVLSGSSPSSYFDVGDNLSVSSAVQGAVVYYGPSDFLLMDEQAPPDEHSHKHSTPDSPESLYLGHFIVDVPELVAKANPITYIKANRDECCPFFVAHGTDDHIVAFGQSVSLVDALSEQRIQVEFYQVEGADHVWKGISQEQTKKLDDDTDNFLRKVFTGKWEEGQ